MAETDKEKAPVEGGEDNEAKQQKEGAMTIEETKTQLAEMYLNLLDKKKGGIVSTVAGVGVNLNPFQKDAVEYLTTDKKVEDKTDIFSNIGKNIKKKFMEKLTGGTILEYDKTSLNKMKALITQNKDNQIELEKLMTQIQAGIDPTIVEDNTNKSTDPTVVAPVVAAAATIEYDDKNGREKVLTSLNKVVAEDKIDPIRYTRGGKTDPEKGLDCSGLLYYTIDQAGLKIPGDSRSMFQTFNPKKLELKEGTHEVTTDVSDIKEGDVIRWNSTNPNYRRSTGDIPKIKKDDKEYRIHHVAFIKKIDTDTGIVTVVESNGAEGVTESKVDIAGQLTSTTHKSELYVAHVNYDNLATKAPTTTAIVA